MGYAFKLNNENLIANINQIDNKLKTHMNTTATYEDIGHVKIGTGLSVYKKGEISVKYGTTFGTACEGNDERLYNSRIPTNHASEDKGYGSGTASTFGHVKISDSYTTNDGSARDSVAASSKAVYDAYTELEGKISNTISELGKVFNNYNITPIDNTPLGLSVAVQAVREKYYQLGLEEGKRIVQQEFDSFVENINAGKVALATAINNKGLNVEPTVSLQYMADMVNRIMGNSVKNIKTDTSYGIDINRFHNWFHTPITNAGIYAMSIASTDGNLLTRCISWISKGYNDDIVEPKDIGCSAIVIPTEKANEFIVLWVLANKPPFPIQLHIEFGDGSGINMNVVSHRLFIEMG